MVTVTMEAEKETAVLKGKTALGLTIADGKGGLILNATWEGEHLEMDEAIAVLDCMIEKHVKDMLTGQQTIDGKWYVLNEDGAMVTDPVTLTPDQDGALTWPGLKE